MHIETLDRRRLSQEDARGISQLIVSIWPKPGRTADTMAVEMMSRWQD
jgi:hypothetical protein